MATSYKDLQIGSLIRLVPHLQHREYLIREGTICKILTKSQICSGLTVQYFSYGEGLRQSVPNIRTISADNYEIEQLSEEDQIIYALGGQF